MNETSQPGLLSQSDHDLLIRIDTRQGTMERTLIDLTTDTRDRIKELELVKMNKDEAERMMHNADQVHEDHEKRLRRLERYAWIAIGAILFVQAVLGIFEASLSQKLSTCCALQAASGAAK